MDMDWLAANRQYLVAAVDVVRARLECCAAGLQGQVTVERGFEAQEALEMARRRMSVPAALDVICAKFDLTSFERDLLLLCVGVELDADLALLCAALQDDSKRAYPTFALAMKVLPHLQWDALAPDGALRRWRLIEIGAGSVV